jgi:hypothetical protein
MLSIRTHERSRVGNNSTVVESQLLVAPIGDENRLAGIGAGFWVGLSCRSQVRDADDMSPGITTWVRVDADQRQFCGQHIRFFQQFARGSLFDCLAILDKSTGERMLTAKGRVLPSNQEQSASAIKDNAIDRQKRMFRFHTGISRTSLCGAELSSRRSIPSKY